RLERDESLIRRGFQVAATVADIVGRVAALPSPRPFTDLEALAIGVWGKRLLWGPLTQLSDIDDRIAELPLRQLSAPAGHQEAVPGGASPARIAGASGASQRPVVVIVLENHEYSSIESSSSAPYLKAFARGGTLFTRFHALHHPSLPNYLEMTSGHTSGCGS